MKCYTVTDSELHALTLANGLAVVFFSIASACLAFGVDIAKDIAMSAELTASAQVLHAVIQPFAYVLSAIFFVVGIAALIWRHRMLEIIKKESNEGTR